MRYASVVVCRRYDVEALALREVLGFTSFTSWNRRAKYLVNDTALGSVTTFFSLRLKGLDGESAGIVTLYGLSGEELNVDDDAADEVVKCARLAEGGDEETGVSYKSLGRFNIVVERNGIRFRAEPHNKRVANTPHDHDSHAPKDKQIHKACKNIIDIDPTVKVFDMQAQSKNNHRFTSTQVYHPSSRQEHQPSNR